MKQKLKPFLCLALLIAFPLLAVHAEESTVLATYEKPNGAMVVTAQEIDLLPVPKGLTEMYALMASNRVGVHLIRMQHGYALVSLSSTEVKEALSAKQLQTYWSKIAESIQKNVIFIDARTSCATVTRSYGFDGLKIVTAFAVGSDPILMLDVTCTVFCRDRELIEIWTLSPAETIYLDDKTAVGQFHSDITDRNNFLDSLNFKNHDWTAPTLDAGSSLVRYSDSHNNFEMSVPDETRLRNSARK